jgi:hypothetical protein
MGQRGGENELLFLHAKAFEGAIAPAANSMWAADSSVLCPWEDLLHEKSPVTQ